MGRAAQIDVDEIKAGLYDVVVDEFTSARSFRVTVRDDYFEKYTRGRTRVEFVRDSFRFLLTREPKESILGTFDISEIEKYFPEFPEEI